MMSVGSRGLLCVRHGAYRSFFSLGGLLERRSFLILSLSASIFALANRSEVFSFASSAQQKTSPFSGNHAKHRAPSIRDYHFDRTISREVLDNYLSRSITMQSLIAGKANLDDDLRMLTSMGAKFIGRSLCLWGGEANLLSNLEKAKQQIPDVVKVDPEMLLEACIFENVTTQVEQVAVPDWTFAALGRSPEKRNFRYADMLYPDGQRVDQWRPGSSVPDVSRPETKLWFYFLAASFIDAGFEAIHYGQVEIMNGNDPDLAHWSQVFTLARAYAANHARRQMLICNAHVPHGGLVKEGHLLLDFHAFPLRIMEVPDKPQEAILKVGFSDSIYNRSKGGIAPSGWTCDHLPYLVEFDNYGVSRQPGQPRVVGGGNWIWGYDEITWFAHQSQQYRADWLQYAWHWVRTSDSNGYLEMPGSRQITNGHLGTPGAGVARPPSGRRPWYLANNPSTAVPDGMGDEETIRAIWAADST
jgi:hypothetical protein